MRGGGRLACDLDDRRAKWSYSPPRRGCEAAVTLPATLKPKSIYLLPRRGCEAAVNLLAALTWKPRRRSRPTYRLAVEARRLSTYLPPWLEITERRGRPTCRLAVDARRRSHYLRH